MHALPLALLSFLLGSIPSGLVVVLLRFGRDIRRHGSGNIGASNVASAVGWQAGVLVGMLDIVKGVLPILIGRRLGLPDTGLVLVGIAAVLGHDFSIFLRLRGGKGVATSLGVLLAFSPPAGILLMAIWALTLIAFGYASLASLVSMAVAPLVIALTTGSPAATVLASVLFLLGVGKHWENILRLLVHREPRNRFRLPR